MQGSVLALGKCLACLEFMCKYSLGFSSEWYSRGFWFSPPHPVRRKLPILQHPQGGISTAACLLCGCRNVQGSGTLFGFQASTDGIISSYKSQKMTTSTRPWPRLAHRAKSSGRVSMRPAACVSLAAAGKPSSLRAYTIESFPLKSTVTVNSSQKCHHKGSLFIVFNHFFLRNCN